MYVAMTRARKKLYISFYGMPSRFVSEIPANFLELRTMSGGVAESDEDNSYSYKKDDEDFVALD